MENDQDFEPGEKEATVKLLSEMSTIMAGFEIGIVLNAISNLLINLFEDHSRFKELREPFIACLLHEFVILNNRDKSASDMVH